MLTKKEFAELKELINLIDEVDCFSIKDLIREGILRRKTSKKQAQELGLDDEN